MGFNEEYTTKNYEKINVKLRDEEDIQFYRMTIFEGERKGKKSDEFVVIDKENINNKDKKNEKDKIDKVKENEIDNTSDKMNKYNNLDDIYEEKENENDENENNEIYLTTSTIIKNVRQHEEEADFEFYIDNENKNIQNLLDNQNELNNDE